MTGIDLDPQLEAFLPLLPNEDLSDPVADRRDSIERAAARPPLDTGDMEIEDRAVPADPDVAVRGFRPRDAQGAVVWLHGGGYVVGNLDTEHPWRSAYCRPVCRSSSISFPVRSTGLR
jgi:acetyl esterase